MKTATIRTKQDAIKEMDSAIRRLNRLRESRSCPAKYFFKMSIPNMIVKDVMEALEGIKKKAASEGLIINIAPSGLGRYSTYGLEQEDDSTILLIEVKPNPLETLGWGCRCLSGFENWDKFGFGLMFLAVVGLPYLLASVNPLATISTSLAIGLPILSLYQEDRSDR